MLNQSSEGAIAWLRLLNVFEYLLVCCIIASHMSYVHDDVTMKQTKTVSLTLTPLSLCGCAFGQRRCCNMIVKIK